MRLWAVIICVWYHDHEDGLIGDVTSKNHSCMKTITMGNSWHHQWSTSVVSGDKLSSKNGVMTEIERQPWPEEPIIKSSHRPRRWEEPSSSSNAHSDITSEEHLKILLRILSIQNYFPNRYSWLGSVCRDIDTHLPSTHYSEWSRVSAICFPNWPSTI
jgi:hypothetical protein